MTMPGGPTDTALAQLSGLLENKSAVFCLIAALIDHMGPEGAAIWKGWARVALQFVLFNSAGIFSRLVARYRCFPYKTALLVNEELSQQQRRQVAHDILSAPSCCVDQHFTETLRVLKPTVVFPNISFGMNFFQVCGLRFVVGVFFRALVGGRLMSSWRQMFMKPLWALCRTLCAVSL